jgi:hypothetical protein
MNNSLTVNFVSLRAMSTLNVLSDTCAICREHVCEKCIKCAQSNNNSCDKNCYSVLGTCKHSYHHCCIQSWTNNTSSFSQKCPMCNQKWELKKRKTIINSNKHDYINNTIINT